MKLFTVFLSLLLASCSTLAGNNWDQHDPFYEWEKRPSRPPMSKIIYVVDVKWWQMLCPKPSDACAQSIKDEDTCYIISPRPITDAYLDWHERKHCAGYDHKNQTGGMK